MSVHRCACSLQGYPVDARASGCGHVSAAPQALWITADAAPRTGKLLFVSVLPDDAVPGRARADEPGAGDRGADELMLAPAARLLWRSARAVHLELAGRAVVVDGLPADVVEALAARAGVRTPALGAGEPGVRGTLADLRRDGYLWARAATDRDDRLLPPTPRLAPELAALTALHGERGVDTLAVRRRSTVAVQGAGRVPPQLAALLAASGVGRVVTVAHGPVRLAHAAPGGVTPADEGQDLRAASAAAVRRAAPDVDVTPLPPDGPPDLVVLVGDGPVDDDRRRALHAAGTPHLAVTTGIEHGVVGPLVVPGLTSCLRCADLHRRDRDAQWSVLATQLALPRRYGPSTDVVVATLTAGVAALQALAFVDGADPAAVDGTLELRLPDWRVRRRSWTPHPSCECGLAPMTTPG